MARDKTIHHHPIFEGSSMSESSESQEHYSTTAMQASFPPGQHLCCEVCGAEVAIVKPCTCQPPDQVLRCCGKEMTPTN